MAAPSPGPSGVAAASPSPPGSPSSSPAERGPVLRLDPISCDGHGICAELLPELIEQDDWGYPIIDPRPVPPDLQSAARRAVTLCPTLALRLERP